MSWLTISLDKHPVVLLSLSCLFMSGFAHSCILVEEWQEIPTPNTINNADEIYVGRFIDLRPLGSSEINATLEVLETLKGRKQTNISITTRIIPAVYDEKSSPSKDHSDDEFWAGLRTNTRLMSDCSYVPIEYHVGGTYIVLLTDGKIVSSSGFERIREFHSDAWYQFVVEQTRTD